jgi:hypothetical protein
VAVFDYGDADLVTFRLPDPRRHLRLVEIVLVDVDPAHLLARTSEWNRS